MSMIITSVSRLRGACRRFLIEGRLEDAQKRFPEVDVSALASQDPSGSQLKYLSWMAKQLAWGDTKLEDLIPAVQYFHSNLPKFSSKDIEGYKTLNDLEDAAKAASEKKSSKEKRQETKEGSETIYEDERVALIYVGSKESCQLYGKGTKWCITMRDASFFEQYTGANVVFYFLLRKQPTGDALDKVAFVVKRNKQNKVLESELELYDAQDIKISRARRAGAFSNISFYIATATADAFRRPKGLIAKIKDQEASLEEEKEAIKLYSHEPSVLSTLVINFRNPEILTALSKDKNFEIRCSVASNIFSTPEILLNLSKDKDFAVKSSVVDNISSTTEVLLVLSKDKDHAIRYSVAQNTSLPEVLAALSRDENIDVRAAVARNSDVSAEILNLLIQDREARVRREVAINSSTTLDILNLLMKDKNAGVRENLARNKKMSIENLKILAQDKQENVRYYAQKSLFEKKNKK